MAFIHHPAFQSLALPVVLAVLGMLLLQRRLGARHAPWGAGVGLLLALAWLPGFDLQPGSGAQKWPWVVLVGLALGALAVERPGARAGNRARGAVAVLVWSGVAAWLAAGRVDLPFGAAAAAFGAFLLARLATAAEAPAPAAGAPWRARSGLVGPGIALVLASLALAVLAARGGSLLLAQLGLMLASTLGVACAWVWRRPGPALPAGWVAGFGLAWASLAWLWVLAAPMPDAGPWVDTPTADRAARAALLAAGPLAVSLWPFAPGRPAARARWWALGLALAATVLAVAWPDPPDAPPGSTDATDAEDPYTVPSGR